MRELTAVEDSAALWVCRARHAKDTTHRMGPADYCPDCRAAVVALVDGASAEPWPEVREEDVDWVREGIKMLDERSAMRVLSNTEDRTRLRLPRILAILEYARTHAQQAQEKGR